MMKAGMMWDKYKMEMMWDELLAMGVSEETLQVVTSINGYNEETMRDILYVVSGTRLFDEEDEEEDEE